MSLEVCSDGHDEVCYDKPSQEDKVACPVCRAIVLGKDLAVELEKRIDSLEEQLQEAQS